MLFGLQNRSRTMNNSFWNSYGIESSPLTFPVQMTLNFIKQTYDGESSILEDMRHDWAGLIITFMSRADFVQKWKTKLGNEAYEHAIVQLLSENAVNVASMMEHTDEKFWSISDRRIAIPLSAQHAMPSNSPQTTVSPV
jgi:hypothetical protein